MSPVTVDKATGWLWESYLPDDGKVLYNQVKVMSNHFGGIQTQCAIQKNTICRDKRSNSEFLPSNVCTMDRG